MVCSTIIIFFLFLVLALACQNCCCCSFFPIFVEYFCGASLHVISFEKIVSLALIFLFYFVYEDQLNNSISSGMKNVHYVLNESYSQAHHSCYWSFAYSNVDRVIEHVFSLKKSWSCMWKQAMLWRSIFCRIHLCTHRDTYVPPMTKETCPGWSRVGWLWSTADTNGPLDAYVHAWRYVHSLQCIQSIWTRPFFHLSMAKFTISSSIVSKE